MNFNKYQLTTAEINTLRSMERSEKKRLAISLGNLYLFVMFYFARSFRRLSEIMNFEGVSDLYRAESRAGNLISGIGAMLHFRLFLLHQIITKEFDCLPLYEESPETYTFVSKKDKDKFFPLTFDQLAGLAAQNGNLEAFKVLNNERDYKKAANLLGLSHHYEQYEFLVDSKVPGSRVKRLDLITEFEHYLTAKICLPPQNPNLS